jgi:nitroreductase
MLLSTQTTSFHIRNSNLQHKQYHQTSPSGFNLQPTHMLLLRSPQIKSTLSKHAMLGFGNQYRTNDASAIAVFCADLEPSKRIDRIFDMERKSGIREDGYLAVLRVASSFLTGESSTLSHNNSDGASTHVSTFLKRTFTDALSPVQPMPTMENVESWSYKNAGIMAQMYTMSATAHGLSTCMMEGFDARRAKEILRIPDRYGIPLMVATGYDYGAVTPVVHADLDESLNLEYEEESGGEEKCKRTPRLEMNEVFFGDTFGEPLELLHPPTIQQSSAGVEEAA